MKVENLELKQDIDDIKAENLELEQKINATNKVVQEHEDKLTWKLHTLNLKLDEIATVPEITNAREIYIKASYNTDSINYAIMTIVNDDVNGYYNMEAYYWQGAYPISISLNWKKGTIRNCTDKSNIVLVAYR